jgi:hypothetical protein
MPWLLLIVKLQKMKNRLFLIAILLATILLSSCVKYSKHYIRVNNEYKVEINDLEVGDVTIGTVHYGITSSYVSVGEGEHKVSGITPLNQILRGEISLVGEGEHKWTMNMHSNGTITLKED